MPDPRKMNAAAERARNKRNAPKPEDRNRAPKQEYLPGEKKGSRGGSRTYKQASGGRVTYVPSSDVGGNKSLTRITDQRNLMSDTYETRFETEHPPRRVSTGQNYRGRGGKWSSTDSQRTRIYNNRLPKLRAKWDKIIGSR
jgi:hypothetical protein